MQIKGHTFLVAGGASGLGEACVKRLVQLGAQVVIADMNTQKGEQLAKECGNQTRFVNTNVTDEASVANAVELAWKEFKSLHGAICCAGIVIGEKIVNKEGAPHSLKNFTKTIEVNLLGTFNVCRLAAASMIKNNPSAQGERGVLINTASIAAFEGQMGQVAYSASKGGIVGMMLPMARDLAASGIRVCTIAPGIFETPMLAGMPDNVRESLGKQVPFPSRLGKPEEYAFLAQHIIENEMLNGEVIRLDGAMRMSPR